MNNEKSDEKSEPRFAIRYASSVLKMELELARKELREFQTRGFEYTAEHLAWRTERRIQRLQDAYNATLCQDCGWPRDRQLSDHESHICRSWQPTNGNDDNRQEK